MKRTLDDRADTNRQERVGPGKTMTNSTLTAPMAMPFYRPRAISRDRIPWHPICSGMAVQRLEGREHVLEDGLLYPRRSVRHRTALAEGTRCREIPREPLHQ